MTWTGVPDVPSVPIPSVPDPPKPSPPPRTPVSVTRQGRPVWVDGSYTNSKRKYFYRCTGPSRVIKTDKSFLFICGRSFKSLLPRHTVLCFHVLRSERFQHYGSF